MGGWDRMVDSLPPGGKDLPMPLLTGFQGGHDVDFRQMTADGIVLLGRLKDIREGNSIYAADLEENLARGDKWFDDFKNSVDEYVTKNGLAVSDEAPPNLEIVPREVIAPPVQELNFNSAGITSIVWATGFQYDLGWVKLPILDETGAPIHRRGVTSLPGIYFLGLKFLYKVKSAFVSIAGGAEDAAYLAGMIETGGNQQ